MNTSGILSACYLALLYPITFGYHFITQWLPVKSTYLFSEAPITLFFFFSSLKYPCGISAWLVHFPPDRTWIVNCGENPRLWDHAAKGHNRLHIKILLLSYLSAQFSILILSSTKWEFCEELPQHTNTESSPKVLIIIM